jgi:hypothetical protein
MVEGDANGKNEGRAAEEESRKIGSMRGRESGEVRVAYLVTITRLTEVHGLWVGDGPYTIAISTIDLS